MTLVSVLSLRREHPASRIVLLADEASAARLRRQGHQLIEAASELVSVPVPDGPPAFRNRHVKTRLRELVSGDFLYLDGDTIVRGALDEVFAIDAPFGAVANHNGPGPVSLAFAHEMEVFKAHGWFAAPVAYVNGGVLFFREAEITHRFGRLWHQKWLQSSSRSGRHVDQPALNSALVDSGIPFALLPNRFNAQVQVCPRTALGAHLWHIYGSLPEEWAPRSVMDEAVERCLMDGKLDRQYVEKLCRRKHPWVVTSLLDELVVWRMLRRPGFLPVDAFERLWLAGSTRELLSARKAIVVEGVRRRLSRVLATLRDLLRRDA
jgi:hypothetical protein